mgnify:CR=1 FL=1
MGFLQDNLLPFLKKRNLVFLESYKESEDVYTFRFKKENDLTWKAGQYGLFSITHTKIKNATRPFSVSSAPAENVVQITTRIRENPSDFKKALLQLKQGMEVSLRGPVGPFYLKDHGPVLLIAGGIGITPFRSIVKQIEAEGNGTPKQVNLLYMDSKKSYIFKNELDEMANDNTIRVTYLDSQDDLHQAIDKFTELYKDKGKYYIAGPKSMVESVSVYLKKQNISKQNMLKDAFFGY